MLHAELPVQFMVDNDDGVDDDCMHEALFHRWMFKSPRACNRLMLGDGKFIVCTVIAHKGH